MIFPGAIRTNMYAKMFMFKYIFRTTVDMSQAIPERQFTCFKPFQNDSSHVSSHSRTTVDMSQAIMYIPTMKQNVLNLLSQVAMIQHSHLPYVN